METTLRGNGLGLPSGSTYEDVAFEYQDEDGDFCSLHDASFREFATGAVIKLRVVIDEWSRGGGGGGGGSSGGGGGPCTFPPEWSPMGDDGQPRSHAWWRTWTYAVVPGGSLEFKDISAQLNESMPSTEVVQLQRIQNRAMWRRYEHKRAEIADKYGGNANELRLWHGTGNTDPDVILRSDSGLDERMSKQGFYGKGIYLAEHARYSNGGYFHKDGATGRRQLLLVKAACGRPKEYGMRTHQSFNPASDLVDKARSTPKVQVVFDSVRGGPHRSAGNQASRMYVLYRNTQVYPAYLARQKFCRTLLSVDCRLNSYGPDLHSWRRVLCKFGSLTGHVQKA